MDVDKELLISVCTGLGSTQSVDGEKVYVKDDQCIGRWQVDSRQKVPFSRFFAR